ncbi:MAG: NACHT domain-containing protein, partial [Candidatus Promineifilaceae bacterium]
MDLIQTKLQIPRVSPNLVARPHLLELLDRGLETRLSLLCSPAGYGKTTLLCSWLQARTAPCAWVTLEPADNDLVTFLSYFIAAIRTQVPNACSDTKSLLNALQLPPPEHLTNSLINELAALPQSVCLVLDDYHEIRQNDIHELVAGLIRYPLPALHLVLATRHDLPFSLTRLRGAEKMTEIRVRDLRFTDDEAQEYMRQMLDLDIEPDLVAKLVERTEGWPVGLRMAALAIRDHADPAVFVDSFHGNHRYVTSYFVDETFAHQPPAIQRFLLRTSILDRFCAGLCDAVAGQPQLQEGDNVERLGDSAGINSSQEILERLEKSNLFVTPMDQHGEWFRYHRLFRDLLTHRLLSETTEAERATLHIAASKWLEENGFVEEALRHRVAANDFAGAAETVARARYAMLNETRWQQIEQWLRSFPPYVVEDHPDLLMIRAWIYYHHGHNTLLPEAIENVESKLNKASLPPEAVNRLQGEMSALKALLQYYASDPDGTIASAEKSIQLTASDLWIVRILARLFLGAALQMKGDLGGAYAAIYAGYEERKGQSNRFKSILLLTACWIHWIQSDLAGLAQTSDKSLQLSNEQNMPEFTGWAHLQRGTAAYHQNDLELASEHFASVVRQPYLNYGQSYLYSACGLALTYQAQNRPDAARDIAEAAVGFFLETGNTTLLAVAQSFQAELALRQGQIAAADQWAHQLDPIPPLSPLVQ